MSDRDISHDLENASPQWRAHSKNVDPGRDENGADKAAVQASGNGIDKGAPDGVSASPSEAAGANVQGVPPAERVAVEPTLILSQARLERTAASWGMAGRPTSATMVASRPAITVARRPTPRRVARTIMRRQSFRGSQHQAPSTYQLFRALERREPFEQEFLQPDA
jgi:hypothetical protein